MPTDHLVADLGELSDAALQKQEGVLNPRIRQVRGEPWSAISLPPTRMWDRDGEPNAYHAAQLVTLDLETGEHRFHRPHAMCGLSDAFMKLSVRGLEQTPAPSSQSAPRT